MAEAAGLILGVIGVSGLFSACIGGFDVIISAKKFSEDYEQLCALFSLQRVRFGLWGESVGLVPSPHNGKKLRYDKNLDRPDIRPGVERILNNVKSLLDEAAKVDERYGPVPEPTQSQSFELSSPRGLDIFKASFDKWKSRLKKHQKDASTWHVTRWAVHDVERFEGIITRLKDFVDGLESITKSLGLLEDQHARLRQEIESISDTQSLRLLRDASSRHGSSEHVVSDTASRRLITIAGSVNGKQTTLSSSPSFFTARTKHTEAANSLSALEKLIPGAWPESLQSDPKAKNRNMYSWNHRYKNDLRPHISCSECFHEHHECTPGLGGEACTRCLQKLRDCSFVLEDIHNQDTKSDHSLPDPPSSIGAIHQSSVSDMPQNQRLLSGLALKAARRTPLSFKQGDANYGERLKRFKKEDETFWLEHSGDILSKANSGSSAAKRMFFELRNIRAGKVPFVTAAPLDDSLDRVLASIEGPPETPYEDQIYHPNISPQGHICADYEDKWNAVLSGGSPKPPVTNLSGSWYQKKASNAQWSLGALLTALCGLLASPDVDDPLVPEVAQVFVEDYETYYKNAKLYTQRFATERRPRCENLVFLDQTFPSVTLDRTTAPPESSSIAHSRDDLFSSDDGHIVDDNAVVSSNRVAEIWLQPEESMWTHQVYVTQVSFEAADSYSADSPLPLFQKWKASTLSREKLKESAVQASSKEKQDLQNLVSLCRALQRLTNTTRDIDIVWLLLDKANLVLAGRFFFPAEIRTEVTEFYMSVKVTLRGLSSRNIEICRHKGAVCQPGQDSGLNWDIR